MSEGTSKFNEINEEQSENAESVPKNENTNCKDADSDVSDELFSDADEAITENRATPEVLQSLDDCSFLNSFRTPVMASKDTTPGQAVVPSTPLSLVPFINKINEPWTSELETPDAKLATKAKISSAERSNCLQSVEQSSSNKQLTPILENIRHENTESSSPVLNKNVRKRPKRRIFKLNTSDNAEIPQNLEKQTHVEESTQNDDKLHNNRTSPLPDQLKTSPINPNPISTLDNKKSSPKCLDSNILEPDISKPSTSSVEKSLGDIVRNIKHFQKKRRLAPEINQANVSEIDLCKDAIQLECASAKFSNPTKEVPIAISQIGLVPFSQFYLEMGEEPSNEVIISKDQKEEGASKSKEELKEQTNLKEKENARNSKRHTMNSKTVKIFNNSTKSFENSKERLSFSGPVISLKNEEDVLSENIEEDLQFSQWLYKSKDDEKKDAEEMIESRNSEKEESKNKDKDIEILVQFDNKLSKGSIKESTISNCGFSSAKGKLIQINEDKLQKAKSVFKDVEDIHLTTESPTELLAEDLNKRSDTEIVKCVFGESSKELPGFGFSTAKGKPIQFNEDKLQKVKTIFKDVENIEDIHLEFTKELAPGLENSTNIEIMKEASAGSNKKPTIYNCGFSTAKGKRIQVNEDKLQKARSLFKDVEVIDLITKLPDSEKSSDVEIISQVSEKFIKGPTIEDIDLITEFTKDVTPQDLKKSSNNHQISSSNKKFNLINLKPISLNFKKEISKAATSSGFSTAKGASIQINNDKLRRAGMIFKDVEDIESVLESVAEKLQTAKPNIVLGSQPKDSPKLEAKLISGFSLASVNTKLISEVKNPICELIKNSDSGFSTASGKSIVISEQKMMIAKQMYDETAKDDLIPKDKGLNNKELTNKENHETFSPVKFALASNSKVQTTPNTNLINKCTFGVKRKLSEEDSINSKRLRTSDFIDKSISEVQGDNKVIESNEVKDEIETVQCGFVTARGKKIVISNKKKLIAEKLYENMEVDNIIPRCCKSVVPKRNFSLPVISQNKDSFEIEKRRSLKNQFSNVKDIQQLGNEFQQMRRGQLRNNLLIKPSTSQLENVPKYTLPESPPFAGFYINDFEKSAALVLKSERFLKEEEMKLNSAGELELAEDFLKISGLNSEVLEKKNNSKIPVAFATAGGRKLSVNKGAVSKAQFLYSNENVSNSETVGLVGVKINTNSTKTVRVSQEALQKKLEISEISVQLKPRTSGQKLISNHTLKRSNDDVDGETPLGRNFASKSKKPKLTCDLRGRKLFSEDSESDEEIMKNTSNQITSISNKSEEGTSTSISTILSRATNSKDVILSDSLLSEDIIESVQILEKEIKVSNEVRLSFKYNSEIQKEKKNSSEDVRRSPILGKKKRKRKTMDLKSVEEGSGIGKEERRDSDVNTDSRTSSQSLETESLVSDSDILESRISASFEQDKIIARKKKKRPRPIKGSLLQIREENRDSRISLHQFSSGSVPTNCSLQELKERGVDLNVLEVSALTSRSYKFRITDINRISNSNMVSLEVGDGAKLILDENGSAGVTEFERAFEASPGVDPKLLPPGWIQNHYRWIVWKLASMDRIKLGSADIPRMLTPDRVMKDLKYRYDREIDRSQRSAIRKILEKDDLPSKRVVLCIASIKESTDNGKSEKDPRVLIRTPRWKIEVTDGWYSLPVSVDAAMVKKIIDGKVQEGTKLVTYGAELLNCDRGCFPLEKSADVCLKIHTNCTRRARWDTKLGYQRQTGPIPTSLKTIDPCGGLIGKVTVVVSRIYPILFREKTADGQSIYRNAKNEEKAQMAYEQAWQSKIEAIVAKLQEGHEEKHNCSEEDSAESLINYDSASDLTESQRKKLVYSRQAKEERLQQKIAQEIEANRPPPRNVVPVQKVRVVEGETSAILTIWSKSEEVSILKEGGSFSIFNISAYGKGDGNLNLTASRQAVFKSEPTLQLSYPSRIYTPLQDVTAADFQPPYCELDTVGVVSWIGNTPHGMKNFEAICVSYPNEDSSSSTYLSILFWQGLSSHGFSNILTVGSLIACSNLEYRRTRNAMWSIPICYCSERTVFTQNPRQPHLLEAFEDLKRRISDPITYTKKCGEEISSLIPKKPISRVSAQGISNSTPISGSPGFQSPHFAMVKTPLDFDTPAKSSATQKRLERLASYGQPPEISPIIFTNSSNVRSNFRPVIRTPDSAKSSIPADST